MGLALVFLASAPGAQAATTPAAFGNCGKAAADRAWKSSDMPQRIKEQLDFSPFNDPDFRPERAFILQEWACQDYNGDGIEDLFVALECCTVSSPDPWAIIEVRAGQTRPTATFVQARKAYLSLSPRATYVEEREKTFSGREPNCCPQGPTRVRFVRWTGQAFEYTSKRPPKPQVPDGPPDGYDGVPTPSTEPGCEARIAAGPVELTASCFRRRKDGTFAAEGRVRLNGIDIVPAGSTAEVVFDPKALELRAKGTVRLQVGSVVLYEGSLERKLGASFTLRIPGGSSVKGFPVNGEARITLRSSAAEIDVNVGIPALGGVSGTATLNASTAEGLRIDALSLKVPQARVGAVPIKDVALAYTRDPRGDVWFGGATIELPGPRIASLTGGAGFINGRFANAFGELTGPGVAVFPGIFITQVRASLTLEPNFAFGGGMTLSAGPKVLGATAASVDGNFAFASGTPSVFRISGDIKLVKVKLSSGSLEYRTNGQINMAGNLDLTLGGVGFQGDLAGFVDGLRAFNAGGSGTVGFKGKGLGGKGLVSSRGAAACTTLVPGVAVGFGVGWKSFPKPEIMHRSCDVADWRVGPASAAALAPGQTRNFRVRRGSRVAVFAATGQADAPNVTLKGPGGTVVSTPLGAEFTTLVDGRLAFRNTDEATTYFAIPRPRAGRWSLSVEAGSVAVDKTQQAGGRPRLSIEAGVSARGSTRRLRYRVGRQSGLNVAFYERAGGSVRRLASVRGGRGSVRFRPAPGPAVRRQIVAVATQDGTPRDRVRVARFKARVALPGRPARVSVRRRRGAAVVTWSRSARAARHLVRVRVSDGRRLLFTPRRKRRVLVRRVGGRRVVATVRGLDSVGRAGPKRTARARR